MLAFAVLAWILLLASSWYQAQLIDDERKVVEAEVNTYAKITALELDERYAKLEALAAFVSAEDDGTLLLGETADAFAAELLDRTDGILGFALAPNGLTRWRYPQTPSHFSLGESPLDLVSDGLAGAVRDEEAAIRSGHIVLSAPHDMQSVVSLGMFRHYEFLGIVAMELDLPPILDEAREALRPDVMEIAIRGHDGEVFFGPSSVFSGDPVTSRVELSDNHWEVGGRPLGGWEASVRERVQAFQLAGLAVVGLLAALVYLTASRQTMRRQVTAEQARELTRQHGYLSKDVARRRRMEETLRESLLRLTKLMGVVPALAYRCGSGQERPMEFVSDGCEALTGYATSELVSTCRGRYSRLIHPDDRERAWHDVRDAVRDGLPYHSLYRIVIADGTVRWVLDHGRGVADNEGQILALEGLVVGVTLPPAAAQRHVSRLSGQPVPLHVVTPLTEREEEILRLVASGMTNQQIADVLVLSERTVRNHVSRLLAKLHLDTRTQAAVYAVQLGLTPPNGLRPAA